MNDSRSYVYFALKGDDCDPEQITQRLGISPTEARRKGEQGHFASKLKHSYWQLTSGKSADNIFLNDLVLEVVTQLEDKAQEIAALKREFQLDSVLEVVMFVDVNEEQSTPALNHDLRTINFLYHTGTSVDVDIYRYNSQEEG